MTDDALECYGGVDWASEAHVACVVDGLGNAVDSFDIAHSAAGLRTMCERFRRLHVRRVAIERGDGPIVDALLGAGLEVVVVSTRAVKALRTRYGLAGNKDDRGDAFVLADALRTDGARWPSLQSDSPATVALRALVRTRSDLISTRIATANQLRAHLELVFPGAAKLFYEIDSAIALRFLERFTTAERAAWLSERRLANWLDAVNYPGRTSAAQLYGRLNAAPAGLVGPAADVQAAVTLALVAILRKIQEQVEALDDPDTGPQ